MKKLATMGVALAMAMTLSACDSLGGGSYSANDAQAGAQFRFHSRDVVAGLNPVCPYSQNPELLAQYDEVIGRFDAVRESISGRSLETDLAIVQADYNYYWDVNQAECGEVDAPGAAEQIAQEVAKMSGQLEQLERIVGGL